MKTTTLTLTAFLLASSALAQQAQTGGFVESAIADLTDQGYTQIEIKNRIGTIKIEAVKDGQQRELVFDRLTGELVRDETNGLDDDEDDGSGGSGGDASGPGGSGGAAARPARP